MTSAAILCLAENDIARFLSKLQAERPVPLNADDAPPWFESGVNCEFSREIYFSFLDRLAPRWIWQSSFVAADHGGPSRLFWHHDGQFFGRELTGAETLQLYEVIGLATVQNAIADR